MENPNPPNHAKNIILKLRWSHNDLEVVKHQYPIGIPYNEIQGMLASNRSTVAIKLLGQQTLHLKRRRLHALVCSSCGLLLTRKNHRGYYGRYCHDCKNSRHRDVERAHNKRMKYLALAMYSGEPPHCVCCNEPNLAFLTIDHIAGGGRNEIRNLDLQAGRKFYAWLIKQPFNPSKYRTLCYNCNYSYGIYGYCPHKGIVP